MCALRTTEPAAEMAVIGGVLLAPDSLHQIGNLTGRDFADQRHALIFEAMQQLAGDGNPIDVITLGEQLESAGTIERAGGLQYLVQLAWNTPSAANVAHYASIVRDHSRRRQALALTDDLRVRLRAGAPVTEAIGEHASAIERLAADDCSESWRLIDVLTAAIDDAEAAHDARRNGKSLGAPWGLPSLDRRTGGLKGPRLWILAGRPGAGKTALVYQGAVHAALRGHGVGIVSLEMGSEETGARMLAARFGLNAAALARGDAEAFEKLNEQIGTEGFHQLAQAPIKFDFQSYTLGSILARVTQWRREQRIAYAVVDHIGLIETEGFSTRNDQLGHISRALKKLAKRLDMPIVAVSQFSRRMENEGRAPRLSDLRDSGNLEQDADTVIALHIPTDKGSAEDSHIKEIEITILKQRNGVTGPLPTPIQFDGRSQRFRELDRFHNHEGENHESTRFAR